MVEPSKKPSSMSVQHMQIKGSGFVNENTGNIKDFYKISSCIGRGKSPRPRLLSPERPDGS